MSHLSLELRLSRLELLELSELLVGELAEGLPPPELGNALLERVRFGGLFEGGLLTEELLHACLRGT